VAIAKLTSSKHPLPQNNPHVLELTSNRW